MRTSIITLYSNDPMGKRWRANLEAASRAEATLGARVVLVAKTSAGYRPEVDPPCPSVVVDGTVIVRDGTVTYEELAAAVRKAGA